MANNFSIEWLSKSFYTIQKVNEEDILEATPQYKDAALQRKVLRETFLHTEIEELAMESRSQYSPTSPNNSCGYTSGSESEVGDDESEGESAQHRRMRTKFTSEQISKLERTFNKHKYLGTTQRRKIAEKLNLSETQVKTWFQNRRMKLKREVQDRKPEFISAASGLLPPFLYAAAPSFQHHALSGQLLANSQSALYPQAFQRLPFPTQQIVHQQHTYPMMLSLPTTDCFPFKMFDY